MAREVIAALAPDLSLRAALGLSVSALAMPGGDASFEPSPFLVEELAAAQQAQACVEALGGIVPVDASGADVGVGVDGNLESKHRKDYGEARLNFLAFRAAVALAMPPLSFEFPQTEGQVLASDLVTVRCNSQGVFCHI